MAGGGGGGVQETSDQVQEQKINTALWNYHQETYKPFIGKYITKTTTDTATDTQAKKAAGQVNAEVMKGVSAIPAGQPGQPSPVGITRQLTSAAGIDAAATEEAQAKVKQRQLGSLQNLVDIGRGQQTNAQQTQEEIAGQSLQSAIRNKESDLQTEGAIENAAGSAVGAGAAIYGRSLKDPGQLYKDAGGDINNVDFGNF